MSFAGFDVYEVEEEAVFRRKLLPEKVQCSKNALLNVRLRKQFTVVRNAECRKPEPCRGDAANFAGVRFAIDSSAVFNQTCFRTRGFPEIANTGFYELGKQGFVLTRPSGRWSSGLVNERRAQYACEQRQHFAARR